MHVWRSEGGGQRSEKGNYDVILSETKCNPNVILSEAQRSRRISFPTQTIIGAISDYISTENSNFQPMNANFGILPALNEQIKDKQKRYEKLANRALDNITAILQKY